MKNYYGVNSNISSLFGSYSDQANILSDYALIKSGSYKKLMKAYYSHNDNKTDKTQSNASTSNKTQKVSSEYTKVKSEADSLKSAAESLSSSDFWKDADSKKVSDALKNFVNEYNDVVEASSKVNSKDITDSTNWMTSLSNTMSKTLAKAGIEVGSDNKLTFNEDTFNTANMNTVKSLFEGEYSYGGQMASKASDISSATVMSTSLYNGNATTSSILSSMFDFGI